MKIYRNKNIESYKNLAKLSMFAFLMNCPNLFICLYSAIETATAVVYVDLIASFGETLHSLIVTLVAYKMVKETGDRYNFGMGRLEVFVSLVCDLLIACGMVAVLAGSALSLKNPSLPQGSLLTFCLLKVINCTYDVYAYLKQAKITKEHPSKLNETEKLAYWNGLLHDAAVGVVVFICYLFREHSFVLYFSPIASIVLAAMFIGRNVNHIKGSVLEIIDVSIPVDKQDEVYDIVMENRQYIKRIVSVNCRNLNSIPHIEISLVLKEDSTYKEIEEYLNEVKEKIRNVVPDAEILLVLGEEE